MKRKRISKAQLSSLPLSPREEEIVKAVYEYRFATAQDITHLLLSKGSLTYVRGRMTALSGGRDYQERQLLFRFPLPTPSPGSRERVYTLGASGRELLASMGLSVDWYYRPSQTGRLNRSHLLHQLLLTRFVCAAYYWSRHHTDYALVDSRLCYELARNPLLKAHEKKGQSATSPAAIPDAWLLFQRLSDGAHFPVLLEVDRGTEYQERFKSHLKARLEFIQSGDYERMFGTPAVIIAYVTTGQVPQYAETRRKTMCAWTMEVLAELEVKGWAGVFRFTSAGVFETLYSQVQALFTEALWYRPDSVTPVPLLTT